MTLPIGDPQGSPVAPQKAELAGRVISIRGSQASVGLPPAAAHALEQPRATVGKFVGVRAGASLLVGLIADVSLRTEPLLRNQEQVAVAQVDLIGEIRDMKRRRPSSSAASPTIRRSAMRRASSVPANCA